MKKILKKNQIIITALALMIAIAGYLNYAGKNTSLAGGKPEESTQSTEGTYTGNFQQVSDDDVLAENQALQNATGATAPSESQDDPLLTDGSDIASLDDPDEGQAAAGQPEEGQGQEVSGSTSTPGTAVLASGMTVTDFLAQERLNREQVRGKNKEALLEIINNENIAEDQKQAAVDNMVKLTEIAEKENLAETLLRSKGFEDAVVTMNEGQVDVVLCRATLTDTERAQVEDIVKRKTELGVENIVITLMELKTE